MRHALKMCSDWCGSVDDLAPWSSPASTSTPPCLEVPAAFACLKTSPQRSTPGPLPYHMEKTPSYFAPGKRLRSEEHTSELQSQSNLVCRLLLEKKKQTKNNT